MGQGISCTDERSTIDLSQQQQQYQQAPILRNNEGLFIEQQPPEYQEYRGITTTNQYNIVSLNTSQISMQKDAYESHSELSRMPSQISIISELKQHIATEDMNPLSTQVFQKYSESNQKEKYSYMSRNQSKEVLQEIISVPQSMNKPTHRPSSNCKLSTRVKEKLLDKDDEDESLALNFSPSKNYKSNAPQQDVNQSHQSSVYSHTSSNSEYTGFRYLQGGMHQLKEQQFKGSFGLQKQNYHNALQSTLPYKSSNFKAEEQKVSKRYGDDKENRYQEEKYEYKQQTIKTEVLQNLERYRQMNNPIQALHEARSFNKQPNSTAIVPVSHTQVVDKEVLGITSGYHTKEKDELISQVKNSTMLREHRSKSKRNEVSTSRNIPVKKFKEDGLKSKKMQTKSSKKNNRKYSSSSSSSQPSLSSHDSYQENSPQDEFAKYSKGKKSKQSKNDSRQVEKQSRNVLSKKGSEQLNIQQTTFNDDTYQQCTAPNSNYNSTQPISHIQQQPSLSLMEERYSNRSTTNPTQHQNSQFSQQSSSIQQKQTTPNCYGCMNQQCNGGQAISSRMNPHQQQQQFPHTCQTKNNLLIDNNNLINRNQSNLSVCQNNSSFNIGVTFPQQQQQPNQLSMYGVPNQQLSSPLSSQYSSTQQQIQQIQHQLIQQQLALAQTQQNHQAQIQNILLQQQQQQQHQAISYIPPYNMMYCSPNQQYLQPQIAQSHIIGNYTNQPMVTPVIDKGNPLMPFYLPHSQQYMPASAVQNKTVLSNISQTNNGIHPEQIDFSNFDKNQLNIYNQQLNPAFPGGQQQQQYVIHPALGNQNQPFPIIINNNVVSPKKNKAKNGFDINDNKNMILSHEITDDKLKNMQSLSFNINSSQNSDDFKNNKKKAINNANNENKFLETSISEIEEKKRNSNGQAKQKNQRNNKNYENDDDDDGFDINIADEDFEEIKGAQTRNLSGLENTNANKPLALQTRTNVNAESYRMHTRSSTQDKDTFTFRNQNKNGKNQSLLPNNFEDMIKNTKIANNIQLDDQDEAGLPSSTNNGGGQQKSLAEIFQERRKKLAQKMEGQKRGFSAVQAEEKSNNEQNDHSQLMDDMAIGGQTHQKENKGKRTKDEMIKLRQEMKEYGSRVNPKLKAKTQQKIQAEQEQLNQVQLNGTSRMKSPSYSKKREELMIRLAQGVKPKIDEKEMYALTKKNYDNLPEVKRKRQEQEKLINKQEMLKAKQEKLKELDEKRRGKFKQKSSVSNLTSNKSFSNNYSSTQLIS